MDEYELAKRAYALPARFADRVNPADLATIREYAEVGEWGEEVDLLLACLGSARHSVTAEERGELVALLDAMGWPSTPVDQLGTAEA